MASNQTYADRIARLLGRTPRPPVDLARLVAMSIMLPGLVQVDEEKPRESIKRWNRGI